MKIVTLVENTTDIDSELNTVHGLSLYIETQEHKILFDVGPDDTLFVNAEKLNIDLTEIDTVIISHGHYDHGGALEKFLNINKKAVVYIQQCAFDEHLARQEGKDDIDISIDVKLQKHDQVRLLNGDEKLDDELMLFTVDTPDKFYSSANDLLYSKCGDEVKKDDFLHEQNLIISEQCKVLTMGCAHKGVINIMEYAKKYNPEVCIGGFHLFNPDKGTTVPKEELDAIAEELAKLDVQFYTCHCTGIEAYEYLSERVENLHYMSAGTILII